MTNIQLAQLTECLEGAGAYHGKKLTDNLIGMYFTKVQDLDAESVVEAFATTLDDRYFPTPARIRELVTGIVAGADWHTIIAVASGAQKSATISGVSAAAIVTAVTTANVGIKEPSNVTPQEAGGDPTVAAVRKIAFCDDPFVMNQIRKDWFDLVAVPPLATGLPPADVEITLTPKRTISVDIDYPSDDDYRYQTAAMIRVILEKKAVSPAWTSIIDRFPTARKAEVLAVVEANGWVTPVLTSSTLYKRYQSVGEAMREINELAINDLIHADRKIAPKRAFGFDRRHDPAAAQQEMPLSKPNL